MKKLLVFLKHYKKESVLGPLFKLLEASFELFVPLVIAAIVDKGIVTADIPYIWKMGGMLFLLALIGLVCSVTAQFFAAKAATGFATELRHTLFGHIQSLSFAELDHIGTSTMITRMTSDINQVQSGVNLVLRLFLRSPFIVFGAMIMAFTIDVKAALIFVVTIPLLSIVVFGIMLISIPLYRRVQERLDKVLGKTRENLTGVRVIRAFNRQEIEVEEFAQANQGLTQVQEFVGRFTAFMNPVTYIIINVAIVALIYTGAVRVNVGILTQGQVIALVNYMSQILVELVKLASLIITVTKAFACGDRIAAVLDMKSSLDAGDMQEKGDLPDAGVLLKSGISLESGDLQEAVASGDMLSFKHVSFTYQGAASEALTDMDFTVKKGQTIGIIGGTGSGKSTLVQLIPRFYDVTQGEVYLQGKNVKDYTLEELRSKIGFVLQKAVLFQGTIADNLSWGKQGATQEEMWEALETAQAADFVRQKEGQLSFEVKQGGKNLSGGQKQRLTIARALVRKPEILILDDSASALDYATDAALRKAIREMNQDLTVFIVSQRAASIMYADMILVLDDGEIVGKGTHEELLKNCGVYQEIYYSQFRKGKEE